MSIHAEAPTLATAQPASQRGIAMLLGGLALLGPLPVDA